MKRILTCSALLFACVVSAAEAGELRPVQRTLDRAPQHINHTTTVTDGRGRSAVREVDIQRSADSRTRDITLTGPNGDVHGRHQQASITRSDGARTLDVEGTTFRGKSYSGSSTLQKTDSGYERDTQINGPQGGTRNVSANVVVDRETGSVTKQVDVQRANGETTARSSVRTYTQHTDGQVD